MSLVNRSMQDGFSPVPVGSIIPFVGGSIHTGFLKANGAAISRTAYAVLFAEIGTVYGVGDGTTTFNLPDSRGEFLRGFDDGRGIDAGRALGSFQVGSDIGVASTTGGWAGAAWSDSLLYGAGREETTYPVSINGGGTTRTTATPVMMRYKTRPRIKY